MKIAYLVPEAVAPGSGVGEKVRAQCRAWQDAGHQVAAFTFERGTAGDGAGSWAWAEDVFLQPWAERSPLGAEAQRQVGIARLAAALRRWEPTVVYLRFGRYALGFMPVMRTAPVVVEVNSDDLAEYATQPASFQSWNRATRRFTFSAAAGIVVPTRELAGRSSFARFGRPTAVIPNGIDLARFVPSSPPGNDRPVAVFAASSAAQWNGTDKVVRLAHHLPEVHFEIFGPRGTDPGPRNVTWHGVVTTETIRARLAMADIGLGTLALHRKGMDEACPLKVRECLAAGLPTVIAYKDTDFPEGAEFLLRLPNTEDNVEREHEAVSAFVRARTGERVPQSAIRRLDQRTKEEERLQFLERVISLPA